MPDARDDVARDDRVAAAEAEVARRVSGREDRLPWLAVVHRNRVPFVDGFVDRKRHEPGGLRVREDWRPGASLEIDGTRHVVVMVVREEDRLHVHTVEGARERFLLVRPRARRIRRRRPRDPRAPTRSCASRGAASACAPETRARRGSRARAWTCLPGPGAKARRAAGIRGEPREVGGAVDVVGAR